MRAFLGAASAAIIRRRTILRAFVVACLASLASTGFAAPTPSPDDTVPASFQVRAAQPPCPLALDVPNYLNADQKMMIGTGTWGRSVHPRSPNFFRFEREKKERAGLIKCIHRTALSDRHAV